MLRLEPEVPDMEPELAVAREPEPAPLMDKPMIWRLFFKGSWQEEVVLEPVESLELVLPGMELVLALVEAPDWGPEPSMEPEPQLVALELGELLVLGVPGMSMRAPGLGPSHLLK